MSHGKSTNITTPPGLTTVRIAKFFFLSLLNASTHVSSRRATGAGILEADSDDPLASKEIGKHLSKLWSYSCSLQVSRAPRLLLICLCFLDLSALSFIHLKCSSLECMTSLSAL